MFSPEQYKALRERAGVVDRSGRGRLRLTGEDRRSYLQGLLTNDIVALAPGTGCYTALLTAQGRMIADMDVLETGDAILLGLEPAVTAAVRDHLDRFIFTEDVLVADATASTAELGVYGPTAAPVVAQAIAALTGAEGNAPILERLAGMRPLDNHRWSGSGSPEVLVARSEDLGVAGFHLVVDVTSRDGLADALRSAGAVEVNAGTAEVCRVEAGRPRFGIDMTGETIPLEAGIQDRAISMTKGCYVGQEIIIRVLHRGQGRVARRLIGLSLDPSSGVPLAADEVRAGERQIGHVTSAVRSPSLDRPIALAYVHRDFVHPGTAVTIVSSGSESGAVVTELPFVSSGA